MTVNRALGRGPNRGLSAFVRCFAILALALAACTPIYTNHGYVPSDTELALLVVGKDTRESVGATIGRPTAAGILNDQAWYYVQSRFKNRGARATLEVDREVVAISFDTKGVVENVERFGLEKGRIVAISRRITTTNIKGKSFLSQIFGNVGHLSASDLLK